MRIEFSNEYGSEPMTIGAASLALAGADGAIDPASLKALTFGGKPGATIPPGAPIWSDPVDLSVKALDSLAVSLYLPQVTPTTTWHNDGRQTAWIGAGDQTAAESFASDLTTNSRIFLSGIMVDANQTRGRSCSSAIRSPMATARLPTKTTAGRTSLPSGS